MTVIVGINTGTSILLASDSMGSNGYIHIQDKKSKVFKKEDFIFGIAGSYRIMQLLNHKFNIPKRTIGQTTEDYIYSTFIDSIFSFFSQNNALECDKNIKSLQGDACFLFGYEKELYCLHSNLQINNSKRNYDAIGSGSYHAISSLYSTEGLDVSPKDRLIKAINCANEFVTSVDNTVEMVELPIDTITQANSPLTI